MTETRMLRDAIGVAFEDPNFMAVAARCTGGPLRRLLAQRLEEAGLDLEIVAAVADGDLPPYARAVIVWRQGRDGELHHQTIRWKLAPWAVKSAPDLPLRVQ